MTNLNYKMKKLYFLALILTVMSCDDGDFNVPSFNFDDIPINDCGNLVLYKITNNKNEALILKLNEDNANDSFFKTEKNDVAYTISDTGSHKIYYRIFNEPINDNYFCNDVPVANPTVSDEWVGQGNLIVHNTIILDDKDNVSSSVEDLNNDGDLTNDDTDNDGYPNYIDTDDDGDHILTKNEDTNGDGDPTNDDTDQDGIPNYLDDDDDNDGTPTINESTTTDEDADSIVDYLDDDNNTSLEASSTPTNYYKQQYNLSIEFTSLNLSNNQSDINYIDGYEFGTKTGAFTISDLP